MQSYLSIQLQLHHLFSFQKLFFLFCFGFFLDQERMTAFSFNRSTASGYDVVGMLQHLPCGSGLVLFSSLFLPPYMKTKQTFHCYAGKIINPNETFLFCHIAYRRKCNNVQHSICDQGFHLGDSVSFCLFLKYKLSLETFVFVVEIKIFHYDLYTHLQFQEKKK